MSPEGSKPYRGELLLRSWHELAYRWKDNSRAILKSVESDFHLVLDRRALDGGRSRDRRRCRGRCLDGGRERRSRGRCLDGGRCLGRGSTPKEEAWQKTDQEQHQESWAHRHLPGIWR